MSTSPATTALDGIMLYSCLAAQAVSPSVHPSGALIPLMCYAARRMLAGQPLCLPCFAFEESRAMRTFVQQWSSLIAALLVVLSIVYIGSTIRTHIGGVQERLATLEKNIESIRNAIEGNQGFAVRLATFDLSVNEKLQELIVQRDLHIERNEQDAFNTQDAFQALKNTVNTIFSMTQRIEFVEEILLDMQAGIEDIRKQQNKGN